MLHCPLEAMQSTKHTPLVAGRERHAQNVASARQPAARASFKQIISLLGCAGFWDVEMVQRSKDISRSRACNVHIDALARPESTHVVEYQMQESQLATTISV
jgi:hypothetical protein